MNIRPSSTDWTIIKNWTHFYLILGFIPAAVITTIISIRANPELSEVPDGYEPRHWEYFKHPISRWLAKYFYYPYEQDHESFMGLKEHLSEEDIILKIIAKAEKVMSFYNDHRSSYFSVQHADYYRIGREEANYIVPYHRTEMAHRTYDIAYDPDTQLIPVEGYPDGPMDKN